MKMPSSVVDFVSRQRLGFVATINEDGTPNLSHKGTLTAFDDEHLIFADIHSQTTVKNLQNDSAVEVNVVDHFARKGFRFKGNGTVIPNHEAARVYRDFYRARGMRNVEKRVKNFIVINVTYFAPMFSPAYDDGTREEEIIEKWKNYYNSF